MLIVLNLLFWAILIVSLFVIVKTLFQIKKDFSLEGNKRFLIKNFVALIVSLIVAIEILPTAISTSGIYYAKSGNLEKTIFLSKLGSKLTLRRDYKSELLGNVGSCYFYSRDFDNADVYFEKAKSYLKKSGNFIYIEWLYDAGLMYFIKSDFEKANFYNEKVKQYGLLAGSYILQKDYKKALETINEAPETIINCSIKSFVNKKLSNQSESKNEYEKAMTLAQNDLDKNFVSEVSKDFDKHLKGYINYLNSSSAQGTIANLESYIYNLK